MVHPQHARIADNHERDSKALARQGSREKLSKTGSEFNYAAGCLRICAREFNRLASAGLFAVAALFSSDGAIRFNFATLLLLMCEVSALWIAF